MRCDTSCLFFPVSEYQKATMTTESSGKNNSDEFTTARCLSSDKKITPFGNCKFHKERHSMTKNKIICFIGKSGSGKDYARHLAVDSGVSFVTSFVTRPRRDVEVDGVDYLFINNDEFENKISKNEIVSYRKIEVQKNNKLQVYYYGFDKMALSVPSDKVIVIDAKGFKELSQYYGKHNVIGVYITCDDDIRKQRAEKRGNFNLAEWKTREKEDSKTINHKFATGNCKYSVDNSSSLKFFKGAIKEILMKEGFV